MLTLVPKFALNTTVSEIIFVVDRYSIVNSSFIFNVEENFCSIDFNFHFILFFFFEYEIDQDQ
jgi:hypothetical protein